jgi:type II secretion system protein N
MALKLDGWRKYTAYGALFLVAFALALRQTFPAEAVLERLVMDGAAQGWQVKVTDTGPGGVLGVRFTGMTLESREGVKIPVDQLTASLRIWPLFLGKRGVDYDARLYEGRVTGLLEEGRGVRRVVARIASLDLSKSSAVRKALGFDVGGTLQGEVDLSLDQREPARSSGAIALRIDKAALLGGQVTLPSLGGNLTLPRADLGAVVAQAAVKEGKAVFDKLEARSPDVELSAEGLSVALQPRLAYSTVFGKARLKLQDGFWQKSGPAGNALRSVAEVSLAPARARDGAYQFQVVGTLSAPSARPAPQ